MVAGKVGRMEQINEKAAKVLDMIRSCSKYVDCEDCPHEGLCVKFAEATGMNPLEFKEAVDKYGL